jgi:hypothetical protein
MMCFAELYGFFDENGVGGIVGVCHCGRCRQRPYTIASLGYFVSAIRHGII